MNNDIELFVTTHEIHHLRSGMMPDTLEARYSKTIAGGDVKGLHRMGIDPSRYTKRHQHVSFQTNLIGEDVRDATTGAVNAAMNDGRIKTPPMFQKPLTITLDRAAIPQDWAIPPPPQVMDRDMQIRQVERMAAWVNVGRVHA